MYADLITFLNRRLLAHLFRRLDVAGNRQSQRFSLLLVDSQAPFWNIVGLEYSSKCLPTETKQVFPAEWTEIEEALSSFSALPMPHIVGLSRETLQKHHYSKYNDIHRRLQKQRQGKWCLWSSSTY
jgi:hypothetical protein